MKRTLGKSGLQVSALGLGCWAIGGPWTLHNGAQVIQAGWGQVDDAESLHAIQAGLDAGITFFDTAANYGAGHSERLLGRALQSKREQVVIATKFGFLVDEAQRQISAAPDQILANLRADCENSLRRLDTDYIDIYQLHDGSYDMAKAPEVMEVLEQLVAEGKIRWYGWSTDDAERARIFAAGEHCTSNQFDLNVYHDNPGIRAVCAEFNLGGINKSPLNRGVLTGKFAADSSFPADDIRHSLSFKEGPGAKRLRQLEAVRTALTAKGHSLAQASLAYIWALDERMVPIPGFRSAAQVQENAAATALGPLSAEQLAEVQSIIAEAG